jgi:hypothetical protein
VAAIARLHDVGMAAGGLVLTEIKATIPADNVPPPPSFQPPVQVSVTGVDRAMKGSARWPRHGWSPAGPSRSARRTRT